MQIHPRLQNFLESSVIFVLFNTFVLWRQTRLLFGSWTKSSLDYSLAHGPFWFFDTSLADDEHKFIENMNSIDRELQRSKEDFIKEHRRNYDKPVFPPAWKTLELASFGTLSKLYYNFSDKKLKERSTPYQPFWVKEMERSWSI